MLVLSPFIISHLDWWFLVDDDWVDQMDQTTLSLDSYNKMKRNVLSLALEAPVALNSIQFDGGGGGGSNGNSEIIFTFALLG
jgi:hypothetical protein